LAPESVTLPMVMAVVALLVKVAAFGEPPAPTATDTQLMADGAAAAVPVEAPVPVPDSATVCGLPVPVSVKPRVALRAPATVGPKTMFAVQLAAAARLVPQVLLNIVKSPGLAPEIAMLLMVMAAVPLFVSVATF
jgi:hypothetical protein